MPVKRDAGPLHKPNIHSSYIINETTSDSGYGSLAPHSSTASAVSKFNLPLLTVTITYNNTRRNHILAYVNLVTFTEPKNQDSL
jgi:hypothetical protein